MLFIRYSCELIFSRYSLFINILQWSALVNDAYLLMELFFLFLKSMFLSIRMLEHQWGWKPAYNKVNKPLSQRLHSFFLLLMKCLCFNQFMNCCPFLSFSIHTLKLFLTDMSYVTSSFKNGLLTSFFTVTKLVFKMACYWSLENKSDSIK